MAERAPSPPESFALGLVRDATRLVWLAEAERFVVAQAHLIVAAQLLRDGDRAEQLVIVRRSDGAVLERLVVQPARAAGLPSGGDESGGSGAAGQPGLPTAFDEPDPFA